MRKERWVPKRLLMCFRQRKKQSVKVWQKQLQIFGLSCQANPFYSLNKTAILEEKHFISAHFSATGGRRKQQPMRCKVPQEAQVRKVNEPTFSIIPVAVFMGEKLITCDKYTSAWASCRFCQAACEQKHFSNEVILAMDLPSQCPVQKRVSTLTKDTKPKLHPYTH